MTDALIGSLNGEVDYVTDALGNPLENVLGSDGLLGGVTTGLGIDLASSTAC